MHINHIAIWVKDLEKSKEFYEKYFDVKTSGKYTNTKTGFSSYFLSFENGAKIEIMSKTNILEKEKGLYFGLAHFSVSLGSKEEVDKLTRQLKEDGYNIVSNPRITGDGYYESVIEDIDGNLIELTV